MTTTRTRKKAQPAIKDEPLLGLENLPQDPAPPVKRGPGRPPGSKTTKRAVGKAPTGGNVQLKRQVATELYGFASMFVGLWGIRDPQCAGAWTDSLHMADGGEQERLAAIVDLAVDILGRNDKVLSVLASGGVFAQIAMMVTLLTPPMKAIVKAHGPGGHGHQDQEDTGDIAARYPAPVLKV